MPRLALFLLVLLAGCAAQGTYRTGEQNHVEGMDFHPDSLSARLHVHINEARAAHNAPPLAYRKDLQEVGHAHSADMDRRSYFNHISPEGDTPSVRMARAEVECVTTNNGVEHQRLGENLFMLSRYSRMEISDDGRGRRDTTYVWEAVDALALAITHGWLESPPHRANLLNPLFHAHGLGVFEGRTHLVYVTQMLC